MEKLAIRAVFCKTHYSMWAEEEESFDLTDEHCEHYYWTALYVKHHNLEELEFPLGECEPINVDITER